MPEIFRYWLQGGRITVGFLGGAQVDRFGNLNSTVIGDYAKPKVRLPGSGGATEIATGAGQIFIVMRHGTRSFVKQLDFLTTLGHGRTGRERRELGIRTKGPTLLVTDLCIMRPDPETNEMVVTSLHPGITREQVRQNTSWEVRFADTVAETEPPSAGGIGSAARLARAHRAGTRRGGGKRMNEYPRTQAPAASRSICTRATGPPSGARRRSR